MDVRLNITNILISSYKYKGFIAGSVKREFQSKYQNSLLVVVWTIINPLAMIFVYTVIFSQIMKAKLPGSESEFSYGIYLCAGILTWGLFVEIITKAQTVFLDNANILKKLKFPKLILPIVIIINSSLNFFIIFSLFLFFLVLSHSFPGWVIFSLVPVLLIQIIFSIGLGMIVGILNVFFRDVGQLFGILLQFWFWLTPIVYPINILPSFIQPIVLTWNPMAMIITSYQVILVEGQQPNWYMLIVPLCVGLIFCLMAFNLFRHHADEIVDEL